MGAICASVCVSPAEHDWSGVQEHCQPSYIGKICVRACVCVYMTGDTIEDQFEKFINLGDDRNIVEVYVAGALVKCGDDFVGECMCVCVCQCQCPYICVLVCGSWDAHIGRSSDLPYTEVAYL